MGKLILLPCVCLLGAAAPAASAPVPIANEIARSDAQQGVTLSGGGKLAQAPAEKKICKQLPSTGSRLSNRACLTEREWKQLEAELDQ